MRSARAPVGITGGSDANWENFSVQWDGYVRATQAGERLATVSDDGSRMWIDINNDGTVAFRARWTSVRPIVVVMGGRGILSGTQCSLARQLGVQLRLLARYFVGFSSEWRTVNEA
jgi:hypothetical protein